MEGLSHAIAGSPFTAVQIVSVTVSISRSAFRGCGVAMHS